MSEKWEEAIQQWYTNSHTSKLEYLDLAELKNPSRKELAHNITVVYDRVCLSSRVHLKNLKALLERSQELEKEVKRLKTDVRTLTTLFSENQPLTKQEVRDLVEEIARQPKLVEEEALRLTQNLNQKLHRNTESYKEALRATENIDAPSLGFLKPTDYPGTLSHQAIVIKQHNTQLQLLVQIAEDIKGIRAELQAIREQGQAKASTSLGIPEDLITKLSNLSLGPTEKPKEPKGKILVFRDPLQILREVRK
ncbi:hypothetical protein C4D60_Mb03t15400 [Musa balbisiana]|uniref:Uncharacterized protein n=1 Tax=Musa balbisiana TaxID=52838 RepID=A0A4S8JA20_MUSBA|nr:hypothetical protein C4D60_Mb03t15400 [Musa balbisiana]